MKIMANEADIHDQLLKVARRARARLRSVLHKDPNAPGLFIWQCTFRREGFHIVWSRSEKIFAIEIKGLDTPLSFRIGGQDIWEAHKQSLVVNYGDHVLRLFVDPDGIYGDSPEQWLKDTANLAMIDALALQEPEGLHVFGLQVLAYVFPRGDEGNWTFLDCLINLVRSLPKRDKPLAGILRTSEGLEFDPENLPATLRHLGRLAQKWSIVDDEIRSEKIDRASTAALQSFWDAVSPHLDKIDALVDTFKGKPQPAEASVLFWLKMAAIEVEPSLKLRNRPRNLG